MKQVLGFLFCILLCLTSCSKEPKETKTYSIARDPSWYPLFLMGREPAVLGFTDDLIETIAQNEKINIQLYLSSWISLEQGLIQNRWDAIASSIPNVLENSETYSFSNPYLLLGPVLVVPKDVNVDSVQQMAGREIGILAGSTTNILFLEQFPSIIVRPYMNFSAALQDLVANNIDGILMPSLIAYGYVRDLYSNQLKVATGPLTQEGLRILTVNDQNQELLEQFNEGLKKLQENGQYDNLLKKWRLK